MPDVLTLFLAALAVGAAVKLMDDGLDAELDRQAGRPNWAAALGRAAPPYALAALAIGIGLAPRAGPALFLASYALGMASDPRGRLPLALPAWAEAIAALALAAAISGWRLCLAALLLIAAVQCADDALDSRADPGCGGRTWAAWLGPTGLWLAAAACAAWAGVVAPVLAGATLLAALSLQAAGPLCRAAPAIRRRLVARLRRPAT